MAYVTEHESRALTVEECRLGDCVVLSLYGALDIDGRAALLTAFDWIMDAPPSVVVVNLERLDFLDCSGIGALMEARQRLHAANGDLRITGASGRVTFVLKATRADAVLLSESRPTAADECPECHGPLRGGPPDERVADAPRRARCMQCGIEVRMGDFGWLYDPMLNRASEVAPPRRRRDDLEAAT